MLFLPLWLSGKISVHGQSKSNRTTPHPTFMMAMANLRLLLSFTTAQRMELEHHHLLPASQFSQLQHTGSHYIPSNTGKSAATLH